MNMSQVIVNRRLAAILALCAGSAAAWAGVPPVLDRVADTAPFVVAVDNIDRFEKTVDAFITGLNLPMLAEGDSPLAHLHLLTATPGLNKNGSMAIIAVPKAPDAPAADDADAMGDADADEEPPFDVVALIPVSEYAAFVKAVGGEVGGVTPVTIGAKPGFAKDIGDGYAAVGEDQALVESFAAVKGKLQAHTAALGPVGRDIAEKTQVLLIANIPAMQEEIKAMGTMIKQSARMAGGQMPGMDNMEQRVKVAQTFLDGFARDAQVGVIGLGADDKGVWIDLGSQFKEGSPFAGYFSEKGDCASLLARVPEQPFWFAGAADVRGKGMRTLLTEVAQVGQEVQGQNANLFDQAMPSALKAVENMSGFAYVMGANPAGIMGGLFTNTVQYIQTSDAAGYIAAVKKSMESLNGKEQDGLTAKATYKPAVSEVKGTSIDSFSIQFVADPKNPQAQQMQMGMGMIFGGELGALIADTGQGVSMVLSPKNSVLMNSAVESAKTGEGLGTTAAIHDARAMLPENRTFEAFVGTKSLMETVSGFMAMMGGPEVELPEKVSHVAIGGATYSGGVHARVYIPADVVTAVAKMGESIKKMQDDMKAQVGDDDKDAAPRF